MQACERCQREKVIEVIIDDSMDVCGHTFTTQMPATRCLACQQVVIHGDDVRRFERRVAAEIAKAGLRTAGAVRFLRTTLGLSETAFADLLDVPVDYVEYWESGKWPVDPRGLAVLAGLVLATFEGKHSALDRLGVLRAPRKLARKVRLHLDGALQHAGKLLQFGSPVFTQPAVA
jgi:putative zinc finger/helix-turn-helix YgiT family protein